MPLPNANQTRSETGSAVQSVLRERRQYNQWVANQTLEDYALRYTAQGARRWSFGRVTQTALGTISFLVLEAIGGSITISFGFTNAISATLLVGLIIFLISLPITYHAAKQGTDIDLLTRGAGFGYIGSTITSLIYACFTFIFFALEAVIMAFALHLTLDLPLSLGYIVSSVIVIPLVTHGITLISRFQVWTQPLWTILQVTPLVVIAFKADEAWSSWMNYSANHLQNNFNLLAFGAASAVVFSLIAQIGEQVDYARFLPLKQKSTWRWWAAVIASGPGWIIIGVVKILIGSFLAVLAMSHGISPSLASDPNYMYITAFSYFSLSPEITLVLCCCFVILSQIKINVTNAYAGSIAWSNFFSRITHHHPGRVVWLVFNVVIALLLMELGIYRVLEQILSGYSILALAWIGTLVADLVINLPLKLRPDIIDFKRAHLYDINPVGIGSMFLASTLGFISYFGFLGVEAQAMASFITLAATFVFSPLIAYITSGKYYIARQPSVFGEQKEITCCICENEFETEDMSHCPAYAGPICSLCCSLDSRCQDQCKTNARYSDQLMLFFGKWLPTKWLRIFNTPIGHFVGIFAFISLIIACLLMLVYIQLSFEIQDDSDTLSHALINVFLILLIIIGIVSWMFSLVQENRRIAQNESRKQNELLRTEIKAHEKTDQALQAAKEQAESANRAKSRYLTNMSHELRSPLNAIMGYGQLLEKDPTIPKNRQNALSVILRSSEHLSDLIEGFLDISKIEAGRLELAKNDVHLGKLLDQIANMFMLQAQVKNIHFTFSRKTPLPRMVSADEKRLRQILINIISNAIKFTHQGSVNFSVKYRNQVAEFCVQDTGEGISEENQERIFDPFTRIRQPSSDYIPGTGLGLTITRLLIDMMGGDISIESKPGLGTLFKVNIMLLSTTRLESETPIEPCIINYKGPRKSILIVDDEPDQRHLMYDFLQPMGFEVYQAADANSCLTFIESESVHPDAFILDIQMPGMNGWTLSEKIRSIYNQTPIIMVSANANEQVPEYLFKKTHNDYLVKPIKFAALIDSLQTHLNIEWIHETVSIFCPNTDKPVTKVSLSEPSRKEILRLARIGYASGIKKCLEGLLDQQSIDTKTLDLLSNLNNQFDFKTLIKYLESTP